MNETMMENGLDFILDAAEQLAIAEDDNNTNKKIRHRAYKYSILHLSSGIELIMKARLYIDNWVYIMADIDKADKKKLSNGDFVSVDFSKCIDRLEKLCEVTIYDEKDKSAFTDIRKIRNQVEHFMTNEPEKAIDSAINRAFTAILNFIKNNYNEFSCPSVVDLRDHGIKELTESERKYIDEITKVVGKLKNHHNDAVSLAIKRAVEVCNEDELVVCPVCKEQVMVINNDKNQCRCYFCGYKDEGEKVARKFLENVKRLDEYQIIKDGGTFPLYNCPECGNHSMIYNNGKYICFSCRMVYFNNEIAFCEECNEPYFVCDDDVGICKRCKKYLMEKIETE